MKENAAEAKTVNAEIKSTTSGDAPNRPS